MVLQTIIDYCCFGKKVRKEKQLLKSIKDNVLELSKEEAEHLKKYLIKKKQLKKHLVVVSFIKWHHMATFIINLKFMINTIP